MVASESADEGPLLREQREGADVARSQEAEVAAVEGGELWLTEALDDGEDSGVDEADVGICIAFDDLQDAVVILGEQVLDKEESTADIPEKSETSRIPQHAANPVIDLYQNR